MRNRYHKRRHGRAVHRALRRHQERIKFDNAISKWAKEYVERIISAGEHTLRLSGSMKNFGDAIGRIDPRKRYLGVTLLPERH